MYQIMQKRQNPWCLRIRIVWAMPPGGLCSFVFLNQTKLISSLETFFLAGLGSIMAEGLGRGVGPVASFCLSVCTESLVCHVSRDQV